MAPFKTSIMLICFLINIVHAGFFEDELNCISQLQFAFKYRRESAMSCLRHAVEFYVEGQRIQVPEVFLLDENKPIPGGSQSDSDLITQRLPNESQSQSSFNWNRDDRSQVDEDFMAQWLQNELYNQIPVNRNEDEEQQVVESSQNDSGLFTQWFQDELQKEKISERWDEDEGQHDEAERSLYWWEKENWSTSDSQQTIENVNQNVAERSPYWWEKENWSASDSQQFIESSSQSFFDVNQNVASSSQSFFDVNQNVASSSQSFSDQQNYPLNYAELYHRELENMIIGTDVPNRTDFCITFFPSRALNCNNALEEFGDHAINSVKWAFKKYTLEGCKMLISSDSKFVFIHKYMKIIINNCRGEQ